MPIYDFICYQCGKIIEKSMSISAYDKLDGVNNEKIIECPDCLPTHFAVRMYGPIGGFFMNYPDGDRTL